MKYYIGADIGTQSTRVIVYDLEGNEICRGSAKHSPMIQPRQGWMEHGKDDIWNAFCEAANAAMEKFPGDKSELGGISFANQSTTLFPISAEGELLYNPISWMDGRSVAEDENLPEGTPDNLRRMTRLAKANWFKKERPDVYARTVKFLTVSGYVTFMLSGEFYDSLVAQLNNWPLDTKNYAPEEDEFVYRCYGLTKSHMPTLRKPGEFMTVVSEKAAAATGLPAGLAIYAGGLDKETENLGAGLVNPNMAYITTGTCTCFARVTDKFYPNKICLPQDIEGLNNYPIVVGKGFWIVSWFRDEFGNDLAEKAKAEGTSIEALLGQEAENIPCGSDGLICIPEWMPTLGHQYGKGMFIGFDDRHGRGHMFKALLEGIAMQMKQGNDMDPGVIDIQELRIGGGGAQSDMFMQIVADVFGIPTIRMRTFETCSLGAAICAAVGAHEYADLREAAAHMTHAEKTFYPIPENQKFYDEFYREVCGPVYTALEPTLKKLAAMTGDTSIEFFA